MHKIPAYKKTPKIRFNCEFPKDIHQYLNTLLQIGTFRSKIHAIEDIIHQYMQQHPLP